MMATKGWKVVKPHVPMIKFRKGGTGKASAGATASPSAQSGTSQQTIGGATGPNVTVLPTIDDIYLPPRFQRRPIDEKEIAYINRGGPD
ncbi:alpha-ketoglutarate dehydrogenase component 4 [Lasioglossum baleicum]|uniref:alpha-ketoglutarate dehydrogenase component 4 n=1 Tax=Lasioglossum baleicum TaxID=434251 RepID=UPI003FCD21C9